MLVKVHVILALIGIKIILQFQVFRNCIWQRNFLLKSVNIIFTDTLFNDSSLREVFSARSPPSLSRENPLPMEVVRRSVVRRSVPLAAYTSIIAFTNWFCIFFVFKRIFHVDFHLIRISIWKRNKARIYKQNIYRVIFFEKVCVTLVSITNTRANVKAIKNSGALIR